eukprot:CFRG5205T1
MSHSSGIIVDNELENILENLRLEGNDDSRVVQIAIENERLVQKAVVKAESDFELDYDEKLLPLLESGEAGYFFVKTDRKTTGDLAQSLFIFITYVPDSTPVRLKMLYASTKSTMKRQFGDSLIADDLFGSVVSDVNYKGYLAHIKSENAPPPLSVREQEMELINNDEKSTHVSASGRHEVSKSVYFPYDDNVREAVEKLRDGGCQYVQMAIDVKKERITLAVADETIITELKEKTPCDSPRYQFIAYAHEYEGEQQRPILFIYSCPGFNCSIKERMLYSSCKNDVVAMAEGVGLNIAKKLEVSDGNDLTHDALHSEIHPPEAEAKKRISKPARPGRGNRRIVRTPEPDSQ